MTTPIEPATLAAFAATATAIVVSPGPDTLVILRHSLSSGRGPGLAAVIGVQLGLLVHTGLAAAGLSVLIASSPLLFGIVAVVGAGYLAWLGIASLTEKRTLTVAGTSGGSSVWRALRDGAFTNLVNPKVIVLFVALYPNFIALQAAPVVSQLLLLSSVLIAINTAWQTGLAIATDVARRRLLQPKAQRVLRLGTGGALLVFAVLMLYQRLQATLAG